MENNIFETFLAKAGSMPGIRIDRRAYLRTTFKRKSEKTLDDIILKGPLAAGISLAEISMIADRAIMAEAVRTTALSAGTGVVGGPAMAATVPADIMQFYMHVLRIMQKLMYLYGWEEDIFDRGGTVDDATMNMLTLYVGVMFGVGAASKLIAQITSQAAKRLLRDVPIRVVKAYLTKQAARKVINKIAKAVGLKMMAKWTLTAPSKVVPVVGAVTSGAITTTFFLPMSRRLKKQLAEGRVFDDEESCT